MRSGKKIKIENPQIGEVKEMPDGMTKSELENTLDQVADILEGALDARLTREEVIEKVTEAYDLAAGEGEEEGFEDEDPEE